MFMGEYNHSIDAKGRVIVPARFREELGEHFVLTKGLDGCLSIYGQDEWKKLEERLMALPMTNANARKFTRFMISGACDCEVDKMGRILIPQSLRSAAGLTKDVVISGVGTRIEIWDRERWQAAAAYDDMDEVASNLEGLGI